MSDEAVFGPLIDTHDVEVAARDTLQLWLPEYLAWAERKKGLPPRSLPAPKSWVTSSELEVWRDQPPPTVLLLSTGLAEPPEKDGRRNYRAKWALGVAVVVNAHKRVAADRLAKLYVATLRAVFLHKQSLGGFAEGVEWVGEDVDVLPKQGNTQRAAGQAVLRIDVRDVVGGQGHGPETPRPDPWPEPPDAPLTVEVTAEHDPEPIA
jgi:hypothetical protein